ncbi:MAG: hypothetical protein B7Z73_03835 [Planctomycetia bacterium 21-64-5]|nr:MAG: hypothetical protein B7Z73_03835 [Planctomycetia bacterium 21-64-5]
MLALALTLRLVAALWWQSRLGPGQQFYFGDSDAYWVLAKQIAHGQPFQYGSPDARIFRMPGYPALLSAMLWLFGDEMPVIYARSLSALLGTAAVAAVYALAATLFDRRTALLAALAAACYPGAIAMSIVVLSEAPFCPLYLAQLAAWVKGWHCDDARRRLAWAVASGLLGGLATLMRPDWLLFVPFAAVIGLFILPRTSRRRHPEDGLPRPSHVSLDGLGRPSSGTRLRHVKLALVMSLALAAVMTPWWWRNFGVYGRFIPTTLQVGASLYDGLNPRATGASDMSFFAEFVERESRAAPAANDLEYRVDRRLWRAAMEWAADHPGRVVSLAASKFLRLWNIVPNDPQHRSGWMRVITGATFLPAIVLALLGIWRSRRDAWPAALACLPAVYLTSLHLIFVSSIRYREPPMLGLLIFAAAAITRGNQPSSAR